MYDCVCTDDDIFLSCQPDSPEDNADPVGHTTTKGCYSGGWTLYSLKSFPGKSLDHKGLS